ncbi:MAG: CAP domain-containing protein [Burkholderiaceae bacterium]
MNKNFKLAVVSTILASSLSACGGSSAASGGSSGSMTTTATTTTTTTTVASASTIVTSVMAANYAGGTFQRAYYDYLNTQRGNCGFGLLQQNTLLDTAAQDHAHWTEVNGQSTHIENATTYPNGFTGVTPGDRMTSVGYAWTSGWEILGTTISTYGSTYGQATVMDMFVAPYHGMGQLLGSRDIGIGDISVAANSPFPQMEWMTVDMGSTSANPPQLLGGTEAATYPCSGTTGVLTRSINGESPSPILGRSLSNNPIGHPIYIKVRDGQTLTLSSYTLHAQGDSTLLTLNLLNRSNDTNALIPDNSLAILMPDAPLIPNTTYIFTATGTNTGATIVPVNITMTFTTGAN